MYTKYPEEDQPNDRCNTNVPSHTNPSDWDKNDGRYVRLF